MDRAETMIGTRLAIAVGPAAAAVELAAVELAAMVLAAVVLTAMATDHPMTSAGPGWRQGAAPARHPAETIAMRTTRAALVPAMTPMARARAQATTPMERAQLVPPSAASAWGAAALAA